MNTHRLTNVLCLALLGMLVLPGCKSEQPRHQADDKATLEPYACGSVTRMHTFNDLFLASQPSAEDFKLAEDSGVRTVINLRPHKENTDFDEQQVVTDLGMNYYNFPYASAEQLTDERFDQIRQTLKTAERPLLLHCSSANRVGAAWLAYRVLDDGIAIETAREEARTVGLVSPQLEARALEYIESQQ